MKFAVLVFPGSNCDRDMYNAAIKSGIEVAYVDYRETTLKGFDGVLIPGGFSFGDYLRSGAMASVAPIINEVKRLAKEGKPILGVCNGFQILTEIGLLPGALLHNDSHLFISRNETLKVTNNQTPFTHLYKENEKVVYPVAHGEGHYYCTEDIFNELEQNNQIILKYMDNPNGSYEDIAGIVNKDGNVCGMMPHPERALETLLGTDSGVKLFESMVESWREQHV
ncbi:phosphoribosylformylglycinamidine synthase subunit PurQ [Staphylococcus saccharolyticus]|uniref:Phosphoribosylformylglycinamidine synthase subunit PurQ n=1 Tax=Staphylococcus saccharolyticus TaxID=33028 RepID=A0A380H868_9STAP|nr:phosphoribosylformylglycinamidine synthase subunit PurQ [Staphylococcus saccharolyticus]MBL7565559.1 phosphoribosylformylglycinamidine synthase subunit PurQ [Staphylococcus saccharolyticus]MBL7571384.1 phosphoribosylformylglycinamidine synthase subunit PurQ [Staphylococcus saccharolyticus]QQB97903.1 phosphoribosylformylglycinamidine synthase subunit PurQ [Staphylococcus saccharolyticus]QRJ66241.1 phosphoribosylformylglycinamidine synthase subunit PurQ [Staphylococcus saccharolyticus]RTX9241